MRKKRISIWEKEWEKDGKMGRKDVNVKGKTRNGEEKSVTKSCSERAFRCLAAIVLRCRDGKRLNVCFEISTALTLIGSFALFKVLRQSFPLAPYINAQLRLNVSFPFRWLTNSHGPNSFAIFSLSRTLFCSAKWILLFVPHDKSKTKSSHEQCEV